MEQTMENQNSKAEERPVQTAEERQGLNEQERMDAAFYEPTAFKKIWNNALIYIVAFGVGAVVLIALYYENYLVGYLRSEIMAFLSTADDSAGFLSDMVTGILNLLVFALVAFLFGFALDINYAGYGRPREVWGPSLRYILPASFGSCLIYVLANHFSDGASFRVSGSILSRCLYYFTMIAIVPSANVLLYLVLPSAVIRMLLTVVSDTKEKAELPLTMAGAAVMTLAMLGITPNHIQNFGFSVASFALIQGAACSLLYQRTNVVRYTVLMFSAVSALYLGLSFAMNCFL